MNHGSTPIHMVDAVTPDECANFFAAVGYDPD
jgi:hypothetical protein